MLDLSREPELHPEILAELATLTGRHSSRNPERLKQLGIVIAGKRDEAIRARASSGIELLWMECEEAYLGIDEVNRGQFAHAKWIKPPTKEGPLTAHSASRDDDTRSTAYVRLTSRYVDAAWAKLSEILLPIDDKSFSFTATPRPDVIQGQQDARQLVHPQLGPLERDPKPYELPAPALSTNGAAPAAAPGGVIPSPGQPPTPGGPAPGSGVPLRIKDLAEEALNLANEKAKKAETRIYDWMVECQHAREVRKVIFDQARLGVGILKGPYPEKSKAMVMLKGTGPNGQPAISLKLVEKIVPVSAWRDPWNIFPDPACGEDIHNGDYLFERDLFSPKQVRDLKGMPGYLDAQIDKVLVEGPTKGHTDGRNPADKPNEHRFEVWYFTGTLNREDLELLNSKAAEDVPKDQKEVYAIVTMVNDTPVRATMNPLDSGKFPYHAVPWQRRAGSWAGVGVAEQIQMPQRMINAATRALANNAALSSSPQIVIDKGSITPADGKWRLTQGKIWNMADGSTTDDVRKAFTAIEFPNIGDPLMKVIEYAFRLAEESTSIPLITQGQSGPTQPDTLGAAQLQNNNANQLLRSVGAIFDDCITEPEVNMYYEWLLMDPDVPDEEKGDYKINAHGSVALVERAIQDQFIMQLGPLTLNPVYDLSPKKWAAEMLKSKRLDPRTLQYSDEERARLDATPPSPPPQIVAAQLRAQTEKEKLAAKMQEVQSQEALERELAQLDSQTAVEKERLHFDRDKAYVQAEAQRTQVESNTRLSELSVKRELALLEYANKHQLSLEEVKAGLAETAMKLKVQKELAAASTAAELHMHHNPPPIITPPTEPPGKAKAGKAYQA